MSLAVPYDMSRSRDLPLPFDGGTLVRFAIGLEDGADLKADIAQALSALV
jgi:cysteine-S-conjugate beta-lyase